MKVFVLGALLLRTLNAQTDDGIATDSLAPLITPGTDAPAEADLIGTSTDSTVDIDTLDLPTGTADVVVDSSTTDAPFGGDATAGPGFTFPDSTSEAPESATIVVPVFDSEPTSSEDSLGSLAAPTDDAGADADTTSTVAPEPTVLPADEDCPPSCYEGSTRLRRRQGVPSSNGGFAAFQWPGDAVSPSAEDDGCSDDVPDWLSKSTGKKRAACAQRAQAACPDKCYASSPANSALEYGGDATTTEEYPDDTTTEEYYDDTTTEEYSDDTTTDEYPGDTTTDEYSDDTTTDEYPGDTTTDDYSDDTTTEGYSDDTSTDDYSDDTTTDDGYGDDTTTDYYGDSTTDDYYDDTTTDYGYGDTTTDDGYGDDTTTDDGYGDTTTDGGYGDTTTDGGYGGYTSPTLPTTTSTHTTFVTSTKTAEPYGGGSEPGYTGDTIASLCPKQCNPFDPAQNKCDITTSCTTTGNNKYYCACRAGFRAGAWNPRDFTKQFKFAAQPYVYVAPGEVCDQVCGDQTCSEVIARPQCQ